jgi:hypothetical protein
MSDTQARPEWWQASDGRWYPAELHPGPTPAAGRGTAAARPSTVPSPATQRDGWAADPSGRHELRFFHDGRPTNLVRDDGVDSYELGPTRAPPSLPPGGSSAPVPSSQVPWVQHPAPEVAAAGRGRGGNRTRNTVLAAGLVVLACAGMLIGLTTLGGGTSTATSPCSLLTTAQVRSFLGDPPSVRHLPLAPNPRTGSEGCTYLAWPISADRTTSSMLVTTGPAPSQFPSALLRGIGTPIPLGSRTAWWYTISPALPGTHLPGSAYFLVASTGRYVIGVQVTTTGAAQVVDRRALDDILARM